MDSKRTKIGLTVLGLGALLQLCVGILHGARAEWFRFGLSLTGCIIMAIFFTGVLLVCKIDSRFNQLEKLIGSQPQSEKDEKAIE